MQSEFFHYRVGFIPISYDYQGTSSPSRTQYIHSTGGFFVLMQATGDSANVTNSKVGMSEPLKNKMIDFICPVFNFTCTWP